MKRRRTASARQSENGLVITLVAVFVLFVVVAMAALAVDVATFYLARSKAQLAADGAALAGARVLANSGITSTTSSSGISPTVTLCQQIAVQVGQQNLTSAQITATCSLTAQYDPTVSVQVQNTAPMFFGRLWGNRPITVAASAVAEAYNPSGNATIPVAPLCVKPWLLPNLDPTSTTPTAKIFHPDSGALYNPNLTGQGWPNSIANGNPNGLFSNLPNSNPANGRYYAATIGSNPGDFPEPTQALSACSAGLNNGLPTPNQLAVAGCVPQPIRCGKNADFNVDPQLDTTRDVETVAAVECLIHYSKSAGDTDSLNGATSPTIPFTFTGGNQNPITSVRTKQLIVSDSVVTVPVYDSGDNSQPPSTTTPVTVIGFVQLFLNPQSLAMPYQPNPNQIPVTIINQIGCGKDADQPPIYGNGPSPVAVRLIHQ